MMLDIEFAKEIVGQFGAMGVLGYAIIRALKMAERITDAIVGAFQEQNKNLRQISAGLESLEAAMIDHGRQLARRIAEAESNIIQSTSGNGPRIPR